MNLAARTLTLAVLSLAVVTAACSDDDPAPTTSSTTTGSCSAGATQVKVRSNVFEPATVTVKPGDTVCWLWEGGNHNVVSGASCSPDGKFSSGAATSKVGTVFEHKFDAAGSFDYYCDPHCAIGMVGKVVVQ